MTNKEKYTAWVKTQEHLPVFMQPWWLDAVCAGKTWEVMLIERPKSEAAISQVNDTAMSYSETEQELTLEVGKEGESKENGGSVNSGIEIGSGDNGGIENGSEEDKEIVAAMPYLFRKKMWMKWILMPQQTQIGGLWLDENYHFTPEELTSICEEAANELAEKKLHYYYQHFPVGSPCPEIFKSLGFKVKERVTYRLEDLSDLDKVIDKFSRNKKRQLQKALSLHATTDLTAEEFYTFHQQCLEQQHKQISYSREFFLVLERKSSRMNQSQIIAIRTADGDLRAAGYIAWDNDYAHYIIAAEDENFKNNGAMALLVLECIKAARKQGVAFDFEGSMIRGVAQHFKQFGSTPAKYYSVEKYYKWWFRFAVWFNFATTWKKR